MKNICLIRHAKSSWKQPELNDFDRPLSKRGLNDAPLMASRFREKNIKISVIISSPAKRTLDTAKIFMDRLQINPILIENHWLYESSAQEIIETIKLFDEIHNNVLLFGHNPGLTHAVNLLSTVDITNIPTCGIVGLKFNGKWSELKENSCKLFFYEYPKMFKEF